MSGFRSNTDGDFERVFMTTTDLIDQFIGEQLRAWGQNNYGQLGDNTNTSSRSSPVQTAAGGTNWKQVSGGYYYAAAIKTDGTLWSWGYNAYGQLGNNTDTNNRSSPVQTAAAGTNWKQVSCGSYTAAAIKTDGTLWSWGYNFDGDLGDNTTTNRSSPVQTTAGGTNWKQVSCGGSHTAAIKTNGELWTWGYGAIGALGNNTDTNNRSSPVQTAAAGTNWKQVSCGSYTAAAIKTDGTLWSWGYNFDGDLGDNTTTNRSSPVQTTAGGTNWKQVSCGSNHTAAIKINGTLWTWGYNDYGKLGDNTTTNRSSPVQTTAGGTNWKQVSGGGSHTAAIKTDGTLWTWGNNTFGELGDTTTTDRLYPNNPQLVSGYSGNQDWISVAATSGDGTFGISI